MAIVCVTKTLWFDNYTDYFIFSFSRHKLQQMVAMDKFSSSV